MTLAILLVAVFSLFVGVQPPAAASPLAYVSSFPAAVWVIDTSTNDVVARVPVGTFPSGIAITPDGAFAYVANQGATVSVIETATNTVVATVPLGASGIGVAITPDGAFAYVTVLSSPGTVVVISTATNAVVKTIDVGPGSPRRVAITPDGVFAYVTVQDQPAVAVISTATNAVVARVPVGSPGGGPSGLAITPDGAFVYVAINGGPGGVAVIATETNSVVATVNVGSAEDVAITPDGAQAYVGNSGIGVVDVIATATNTVVATVGVGGNVAGIAITNPDGAFAYVAHFSPSGPSGSVSVISTATHTVVDEFFAGDPRAVAITPSEPRVFMTSPAAGATVKGTVWTDVWVENFVGTSNAFTLTVGGTVVAEGTATNHATLPWDSRSIPDGAITLTATVRDAAGVVGATTRGLIVRNGVFITSPPAFAVVGGVVWSDIWVEGAAAGPRTFTLSIGGTTLATASDSGNHVTLPWDSSRVADGPQAIVATVRDAAGLFGVATRDLIVQNGPALGVFITSPPAGATVGGVVWSDIWVEGAAAGTRTFTLSIGGTTLVTASASGNHVTLPWDSSRVGDGPQTIVATVRDAAAHVGVGTRTLNIQNGLLAGAGTAPRSAIAPTR